MRNWILFLGIVVFAGCSQSVGANDGSNDGAHSDASDACANCTDGRVSADGGDGSALDGAETDVVGDVEDVPEVTVDAGPPLQAVSVVARFDTSCAIRSDGSLVCWGNNRSEFPSAYVGNQAVPVVIDGLPGVTQVSVGAQHICAIGMDGNVYCWGSNYAGQLGNGTTTASNVPQIVPGLHGARAISAGDDFTCVIAADLGVRCWGGNQYYQLGAATMETCTEFGQMISCSTTPVTVAGLTPMAVIAAGTSHVCAAFQYGTVTCWGDNDGGQIGSRTSTRCGTATCATQPEVVFGVDNATVLTGGAHHTCAIQRDGTLLCWGDDESYQLGDGSDMMSFAPIAAHTGAVTGVSAGAAHTCALGSGGSVECWGTNGVGVAPPSVVMSPGPVPMMPMARSVSSGANHSCAVSADGIVWCWGFNSAGQLGDGTYFDRYSPAPVLQAQ